MNSILSFVLTWKNSYASKLIDMAWHGAEVVRCPPTASLSTTHSHSSSFQSSSNSRSFGLIWLASFAERACDECLGSPQCSNKHWLQQQQQQQRHRWGLQTGWREHRQTSAVQTVPNKLRVHQILISRSKNDRQWTSERRHDGPHHRIHPSHPQSFWGEIRRTVYEYSGRRTRAGHRRALMTLCSTCQTSPSGHIRGSWLSMPVAPPTSLQSSHSPMPLYSLAPSNRNV